MKVVLQLGRDLGVRIEGQENRFGFFEKGRSPKKDIMESIRERYDFVGTGCDPEKRRNLEEKLGVKLFAPLISGDPESKNATGLTLPSARNMLNRVMSWTESMSIDPSGLAIMGLYLDEHRDCYFFDHFERYIPDVGEDKAICLDLTDRMFEKYEEIKGQSDGGLKSAQIGELKMMRKWLEDLARKEQDARRARV